MDESSREMGYLVVAPRDSSEVNVVTVLVVLKIDVPAKFCDVSTDSEALGYAPASRRFSFELISGETISDEGVSNR